MYLLLRFLDRLWLRKHGTHGTTSHGVATDYSEGPMYWTCECDPHRRYYPHMKWNRKKDVDD